MEKSLIRKYFLASMGFGLVMGLIFPVYANIFVSFEGKIWSVDLDRTVFTAGCVTAGLMVGFFSFLIAKGVILNTLKSIAIDLDRVAKTGDLSVRLQVESHDEVGLLVESSNDLLHRFETMVRSMAETIVTLNEEVSQLTDGASALSDAAGTLVSNSRAIGDASDSVQESMGVVTLKADTSSQHMGEIAAAVTDMSTTISSITTSVEKASENSTIAVDRTKKVLAHVEKLSRIESETGALIDMIRDIAKQTEMLAVNTGVEAARAGTAGRSFAVVAGEIRQLSTATKRTIGSIADLLSEMSDTTLQTVGDIDEVDTSIDEVHKEIKAIEEAIEKQNTDAVEIADSVDNSLVMVVSSARRMHASADLSKDISTRAAGLSHSVERTAYAEKRLTQTVSILQRVSGELYDAVQQYRVSKKG